MKRETIRAASCGRDPSAEFQKALAIHIDKTRNLIKTIDEPINTAKN
jgi:hypothetical protein